MSLRDFDNAARSVRWRGRRFICRPLSTLSVQRFLELYAVEVVALTIAYRAEPWPSVGAAVAGIAPQLLDDARAAEVLAGSCELADDERGDALLILRNDPRARALVAREVLAQTDLARIARSLDLWGAAQTFLGERPAAPDAAGAFEAAVVALAERFALDPAAVVRWPYERFLSVWDGLADLAKRRAAASAEPTDAAPAQTITLDDLPRFFGQGA